MRFLFIKEFLSNPRTIGAITFSSKYLAMSFEIFWKLYTQEPLSFRFGSFRTFQYSLIKKSFFENHFKINSVVKENKNFPPAYILNLKK